MNFKQIRGHKDLKQINNLIDFLSTFVDQDIHYTQTIMDAKPKETISNIYNFLSKNNTQGISFFTTQLKFHDLTIGKVIHITQEELNESKDYVFILTSNMDINWSYIELCNPRLNINSHDYVEQYINLIKDQTTSSLIIRTASLLSDAQFSLIRYLTPDRLKCLKLDKVSVTYEELLTLSQNLENLSELKEFSFKNEKTIIDYKLIKSIFRINNLQSLELQVSEKSNYFNQMIWELKLNSSVKILAFGGVEFDNERGQMLRSLLLHNVYLSKVMWEETAEDDPALKCNQVLSDINQDWKHLKLFHVNEIINYDTRKALIQFETFESIVDKLLSLVQQCFDYRFAKQRFFKWFRLDKKLRILKQWDKEKITEGVFAQLEYIKNKRFSAEQLDKIKDIGNRKQVDKSIQMFEEMLSTGMVQ